MVYISYVLSFFILLFLYIFLFYSITALLFARAVCFSISLFLYLYYSFIAPRVYFYNRLSFFILFFSISLCISLVLLYLRALLPCRACPAVLSSVKHKDAEWLAAPRTCDRLAMAFLSPL